mmetsp:Transcript_111219/g.346676  ORF Transcript_111219/g.346676 Transcript_111219/m.346676 type:complete len:273 (+) Transcript_111219:1003-1821(+)
MNRSPSLRLSDNVGWKRARSNVLSPSVKTVLLLRPDQKAVLMLTCVSGRRQLPPAQLPAAAARVTSEGTDRLKSSRLRSTPFGPLLGAALKGRAALAVCTDRARLMAPCGGGGAMDSTVLPAGIAWGCTETPPAVSAVTLGAPNLAMPSTLTSRAPPALIFASTCALIGLPTPVPAVTREAPNSVTCSRPNSMPPYTPCIRVPMPSSAATMAPSSTRTLEDKRSFHIWGILGAESPPTSMWSAALNHASSKRMLSSTKNFAITVAFAISLKL